MAGYWGNGKASHLLSTEIPLTRNMQAPEAPHIYHKDGWYYLLVAEGTWMSPIWSP